MHATAHDERHAWRLRIEGFEGTGRAFFSILKNQSVEVACARLEIGQPGTKDEVGVRFCLDAWSEL